MATTPDVASEEVDGGRIRPLTVLGDIFISQKAVSENASSIYGDHE